MRKETPADHNEVRILEYRALMQRTAGTQLGITQGSRGLVDVRPRVQIVCNTRFEREIKFGRL